MKKQVSKHRRRGQREKFVVALLVALTLVLTNLLPLFAMDEQVQTSTDARVQMSLEEAASESSTESESQPESSTEPGAQPESSAESESQLESPAEPESQVQPGGPDVPGDSTGADAEKPPVSEQQGSTENQTQPENQNSTPPTDPESEGPVEPQTEGPVEPEPQVQQNLGPIQLNGNPEKITEATLEYRTKELGGWQPVTGAVIPGDADLRLGVHYEGIVKSDLIQSHGKQISYVLPDAFRRARVSGDGNMVDVNGRVVGTIAVTDNTVILTYTDDQWLEQQGEEIVGTFDVECEVDLNKLNSGQIGDTIQTGNVSIAVNFDSEDALAKYARVSATKELAEKSVISDETGDYLKYTLTVSAGDDGCPGVIVEDRILDGKEKYIETIEFENNENVSLSQGGGGFTWNVGNMGANETRTLSYRVKLRSKNQEGSNIYWNKNIVNLRNEAEVFAKGNSGNSYSHGKQVKEFVFQGNVTNIKKKRIGELVRTENGSYRMTCGVQFQANTDNNYIIKKLMLKDSLKEGAYGIKPEALPYVHYVKDTVRVYQGLADAHSPEALPGFIPQWSADEKSFELSMGNVSPGQAYYIQYDIVIDARAFLAVGSKELLSQNRMILTSENTQAKDRTDINAYTLKERIYYDNWLRKEVADTVTATEQTIPMESGKVYDATGATVVPENPSPDAFHVPAGCYQYRVILNEQGHWNLTSTTLKDSFGSSYMNFTGYVQVEAQDPKTGAIIDARWVKAGGSSYSFTMEEIGFTDVKAKYVLTYYAKPVNMEGISQIRVANDFSLTGEIGAGDGIYQIPQPSGVQTSVTVTVSGTSAFEAGKQAWYYERPSEQWKTGAVYWVIHVDGNFGKNITLKDVLETDKKSVAGTEQPYFKTSHFREDSLAGIFTGRNIDFSMYEDWNSIQSAGVLTPVDPASYNISYISRTANTFGGFTVNMTQDKNLGEDTMYIVVKSEPEGLPEGGRGYAIYGNTLSMKEGNEKEVPKGSATFQLSGDGGNILKELQTLVRKDSNGVLEFEGGRGDTRVLQEKLDKNGVYAVWTVKVNYASELSGAYRVVDTIPDGMEFVYARLKWKGNHAGGVRMAKSSQFSSPEWTEHIVNARLDNGGVEDSYCYSRGNQVAWELTGFTAGEIRDVYSVDCQIACRVTDPRVLLKGKDATFTNIAQLSSVDGKTNFGTGSHTAMIRGTDKISKTHVEKGSEIEYTIGINEKGYDLTSGDTVTLVDEMSANLKLSSKVTIIHTITQEELQNASVFQEGQTMKIVIPDNQPVTIRYRARVDAPPETKVQLSNKAYWEGHPEAGGKEVIISDYQYSFSATTGSEQHPSITIVKNDQSDINRRLQGARFVMTEGRIENGDFKPEQKVWRGTTGVDGTLTFGQGNPLMEYNRIYQILEEEAPAGFIKDSQPHYFVVLEKQGDVYPEAEFPSTINGCTVTKFYKGMRYELTISNRSGISLPETGGRGTELYRIVGILLILCSGIQMIKNNRRVL